MSVAGTAGEIGGGIAGGAAGAVIGSIFGPLGTLAGRYIGSRVGRMAGRALAEALVSAMEEAKEEEDAGAEACAECGEIDCFKVPPGMDPEEFRKQLEMQQNAINGMSPDQLLGNIERFARYGRTQNDAATRAAARRQWINNRIREIRSADPSMTQSAARAQATAEASTLAALHAPDLVAGGDGTIEGLGDARINSSIGSQWNQVGSNGQYTRAEQLKNAAREARRQGKEKMDIKLEICPEEGGGSPSGGANPSGGPGSPGSGNGDIPMS